MTETIEYEQFEQPAQSENGSAAEVDLSRLSDIPMELSVEIGRTHMTVGETLDLSVGSVVTLERLAGETADLLVNGSAIARGEVVVIDEQYGLRITEILDGRSDPELAEPAVGAAALADAGEASAEGEGSDAEAAVAGDAREEDQPVPEQAAATDGSDAGEA
jgi:flagellar motor switch protein FliN